MSPTPSSGAATAATAAAPTEAPALTDAAFLAAVEDGSLPGALFDHRAHLRLTWLLLRREGERAGTHAVAERLRAFSAAKGAAHKFHVTLTLAWAAHVAAALRASPEVDDFERFLAQHPRLRQPDLLAPHYRADTLASPRARAGWVPPDGAPLP